MRTKAYTFVLILGIVLAAAQIGRSAVRITSIKLSELPEGLLITVKGTGELKYRTGEADRVKGFVFYVDILDSLFWVNRKGYWSVKPRASEVQKVLLAQHSLDPPLTRLALRMSRRISPEVKAEGRVLTVSVPLHAPSKPAERRHPASIEPTIEKAAKKHVRITHIEIEREETETRLIIASEGRLKPEAIRSGESDEGFALRIELRGVSLSRGIPRTIEGAPPIREVELNAVGDRCDLRILLTRKAVYQVDSSEKGLVLSFETPVMDRLVTIRAEEESLGKILMLLFEQYGANFLVDRDVDVNQKVTLNLRDVPLKKALSELLGSLGYSFYETEEGIIRVTVKKPVEAKEVKEAPPKLAIRSFKLRYASPQKAVELLKEIVPSDLKLLADDVSGKLILSGEEGKVTAAIPLVESLLKEIDLPVEAPKETPPVEERPPEVVRRVLEVHYSDPEELKRLLQPFLSPIGKLEAFAKGGGKGGASASGSGGTAAEAAKGGYLVVVDVPQAVDAIKRELERLDKPPHQIEIKACIVERTISDESELGLGWSFGYEKGKTSVSVESPVGAEAKGLVGLRYGTLSPTEFAAVLKVITASSEAKILSNPRITVIEGEQAKFHSGDQVGFSKVTIQEGIETVEIEFKDVGVVLTVSAEVKEEDKVLLEADVQVSDLGELTKTGEPTISTREAQTKVLVKSGDTVVIGGLTSERKMKSVEKFPILGDIPLIGRIFNNTKTITKKSEVIVFITPRIARVGKAGG
ncbi:hypothetical protein DRP77_03585 [Candidatus Poribacteria bacterium]|nr:MAG: hypothetical protein DRP77_03585 [Candidatus Poribacteria bacterium]